MAARRRTAQSVSLDGDVAKRERNAPCVWQRDRQRDAQEGIERVALLLAMWAGERGPAKRQRSQNMNRTFSQPEGGRKCVIELSLPVLSLEELLYKRAGRERRRRAFKALVVFFNGWLNTHSFNNAGLSGYRLLCFGDMQEKQLTKVANDGFLWKLMFWGVCSQTENMKVI